YRLRDLVQRTRDVTVATKLGVPRSTARGWLDAAPRGVVSLGMDLTEPELRQEVLKLGRRVQEAFGAAPGRGGRAANLRVSSHRRAPTGRTRQDADPARGGSGPRVSPIASR